MSISLYIQVRGPVGGIKQSYGKDRKEKGRERRREEEGRGTILCNVLCMFLAEMYITTVPLCIVQQPIIIVIASYEDN